MTSALFNKYLKDPSSMENLPYEELKTLVLQYPFCQNLRYLLLKKCIISNNEAYERDLQLASTFSPDRNYLFQQIIDLKNLIDPAQSFFLPGSLLSKKPLKQVDNNHPPLNELLIEGEQISDSEHDLDENSLHKTEEQEIKELNLQESVENFIDHTPGELGVHVEEEMGKKKLKKKKQATSFSIWLDGFADPATLMNHTTSEGSKDRLKEKSNKSKKSGKQKSDSKKNKVKEKALQSLLENEDIVSETLASLLMKQGQYNKALLMYEKLKLIFPEKSSFFAHQISKIKKKI